LPPLWVPPLLFCFFIIFYEPNRSTGAIHCRNNVICSTKHSYFRQNDHLEKFWFLIGGKLGLFSFVTTRLKKMQLNKDDICKEFLRSSWLGRNHCCYRQIHVSDRLKVKIYSPLELQEQMIYYLVQVTFVRIFLLINALGTILFNKEISHAGHTLLLFKYG
jgi:hypothetical protein